MSQLPDNLTASERATIAFYTGLTGGALSTSNGWDWISNSLLAPIYDSSQGSAGKWGDPSVGASGGVVTYTFDANAGFTAAQEATYVSALTLWSDETNITFAQTSDPATAQVTFSLFGSTSPGLFPDNGAYEYSYHSNGEPGSTSVPTNISAFISNDPSLFGDLSTFTSRGGYGISSIIHEMGHLLGLSHTGSYNGAVNPATQQYNPTDSRLWSIMSYISPSDPTAKYYKNYPVQGVNWGVSKSSTTPQMLDILAAQSLYGKPVETAYSGGQVFGFNTNITDASRIFFDFTVNTNPIVTIWDEGTGNTLDLSGFYTSSDVNLNAGSFSSANGMTDNIGIAYDTVIATAIGGYGDDTFIVNADSDTIDGGAGTNTVIFSQAYASYQVSRYGDGTLTVREGTVTDTLTNIQTLQFVDQTIAADTIAQDQTTYSWVGGSGSYATAGNWIDETTGEPAVAPPGSADIAVLAGPVTGGPQTISGSGAAQQMIFSGLNGIVGTLDASVLTAGEGDAAGDSLTIAPGATINADSAAIVNGRLLDLGVLQVSGALSLVGAEADSTTMLALQTGGVAEVGSLILEGGSVAIDTTSSLVIGSGAAPVAGVALVSADGTLTGFGTFGPAVGGSANAIQDDGTITAAGGTLTLTGVIGSGLLQIGAGATLSLRQVLIGVSMPTINFLDPTGTLSVNTGLHAPYGKITNFVVGDTIALTGVSSSVLQPIYTETGTGEGTLSVYNTKGLLGFSATLEGDYSGSVFMLLPTATGTYDIVTAPGSLTGSTTPSDGTPGSIFAWSSPTAGDWNAAANWAESANPTAAQSQATVAPGAMDTVAIGSSGQIAPLVISGDGNAENLLLLGPDVFSGAVTVTTLEVGQIGNGSSLALIGNAALSAQEAAITDSTVYVASGTNFTVSGMLLITQSASASLTPATLAVYGGGTVQVGALTLASSGTPITIDATSTLEVGTAGNAQAGGITVDAGEVMSGYGNLQATIVYNYGTVAASGGTLAVSQAAGTGLYEIASGATLSILYQTGSEALPTFGFAGSGAILMLSLIAGSGPYAFGSVQGFTFGETIQFAATVAPQPVSLTYTSTGTDMGTLVLSDSVGAEVNLTLLGSYQQSDFTLSHSGTNLVSLTVACFASGTRILTDAGEVPVEALDVGDRVMTVSGTLAPITWIGHRTIDCRRHAQPEAVWPVRILRDAFGPGRPARDLLLSPDHAVYVEDVLIPVKYLIDWVNIIREPCDRVTYWHVELPSHDVVLAEGLPAESYLDTGDRVSFANSGGITALHPAWGSERGDTSLIMDALGYAPLRVTGPAVQAVRARLKATAGALSRTNTERGGGRG